MTFKSKVAAILAALSIAAGLTLAGPAPAWAALGYWYAGAAKTGVSATSFAAGLSVHNPWVDTGSGDHSISEIAVIQGSGATLNAVEAGWGVNELANGSMNTQLWVHAWKNGVDSGYNPAVFVRYCANGTSPCTLPQAGSTLIAGPGGASLAGSKQFRIQYMGGHWWVAYDTNWIGYFPGTYWSGSGITFTSASKVDMWGEIASTNAGPCSDMGDTTLATSTVGAYFTSPNINSAAASGFSLHVTNSAVYNAAFTTGSTGTFRYGGGGYC